MKTIQKTYKTGSMRIENWSDIQSISRKRFIWKKGVFGWGLLTASSLAVVFPLLSFVFELNSAGATSFVDHVFSLKMLSIVLTNFIVLPAAGYFWGSMVWKSLMKKEEKN